MHMRVVFVLVGVASAERVHFRDPWDPEPGMLDTWLVSSTDSTLKSVIKSFPRHYVQEASLVWGFEVNGKKGCPAPPRKTAAAQRPPRSEGLSKLSAHIGAENCATRPVPYCRFPPEEIKPLFRSKTDEELEQAVLNADSQLVQELEAGQAPDPNAAGEWWLVDLYADWCPHCQAFAPTYLHTAVKLMEKYDELKIRFAAVSCEVHAEFCAERAMHGFPTLLVIPPKDANSLTAAYDGEHFFDALSQAVNNEELIQILKQGAESLSDGLGQGNDRCPGKRALGVDAPADSLPIGVGWRTGEAGFSPVHRLQDAARMVHYVLRNWVRPQSVGEMIFSRPWTQAKKQLPGFYAAAEAKAKRKQANANLGKTDKKAFRMPTQWEVAFQPYAFTYNTLVGLSQWLTALEKALPVAEAEHQALAWLRDKVQERIALSEKHGVGLCLVEWLQWLDGDEFRSFAVAYPEDSEPITCTTETCALWTTFHLLSVNAPQGEQLVIMDGIAAFVEHFFKCAHCRAHFLKQYKRGAYGSSPSKIKSVDDLIVVLWRFHAAVSIRVQHENKCPADRQWPPIDLCPGCWHVRDDSEKPWVAWEEVMKIYQSMDWSQSEGQQVAPDDEVALDFLKSTYTIQ